MKKNTERFLRRLEMSRQIIEASIKGIELAIRGNESIDKYIGNIETEARNIREDKFLLEEGSHNSTVVG